MVEINVDERWVKSCCRIGELWKERAAGEDAFGNCLIAEARVNGRRSMKAAMLTRS